MRQCLEVRWLDGGVMVHRARCPLCSWVGEQRRREFTACGDLAVHVDEVHALQELIAADDGGMSRQSVVSPEVLGQGRNWKAGHDGHDGHDGR